MMPVTDGLAARIDREIERLKLSAAA